MSGAATSQLDGYLLSPVSLGKTKVPRTVFHCTNGSYIDETLVCDGINDCIQGTDEERCVCNETSQSSLSICKYNNSSNYEKFTCSDLFFQCSSSLICIPYVLVCNGQKDCQQGEDEICSHSIIKTKNISHHTTNKESFECTMSGISIPLSYVDDLIPDCPGTFEDEVQYFNLLTNKYHSKTVCNNSYEIPCISGHSYCFPFSKLCIYDLNYNSSLLKYCRNGAHLHNCTHYLCPGYFKCSLSYCVPFDLVCNGKWDCPGGHDEYNCISHTCLHLFKCRNQNKCLHLSKVCDRSEDCIYGDDEISCTSGYSFQCPLYCICFAQSVVCDHLKEIQKTKIWSFIKYFKCYSCTAKFSNIEFSFLIDINLKYHLSNQICLKNDNLMLSSLRKLDVSFNNIKIIKSKCFVSLHNLKVLYLQNNKIGCVQDKAFCTLMYIDRH